MASVPNVFVAGTPAKAAEINANFNSLVGAINSLSQRVDRLEGQLTQADLAGVYGLTGFQTDLIGSNVAGSNESLVEVITYSGLLTLSAGGTYSLALATYENNLRTELNPSGPTLTATQNFNPTNSSSSGTWTYSNGHLLVLGNDFEGAGGGRIFVSGTHNGSDGSGAILLLVKR